MTPFLADFFGLSNGAFLHGMLAVALTLLVLDVVVNTEIMSWIALAVFATWGTAVCDLPLQWSVLVFLAFVALGCAVYYTLWNWVVRRGLVRLLTRFSPPDGIREAETGGTGTVIGQGEQLCVRREDRVYPIAASCRSGLQAGDAVRITGMDGATALVEKC